MSAEDRNRYSNLDAAVTAKTLLDQQRDDAMRATADEYAEILRREQEEREILTSPTVRQVVQEVHGRIRAIHTDASIAIANPDAQIPSIATRPEMEVAIWWGFRIQEQDGFESSDWKEIDCNVARYEDGRVAGLRVTGNEFESPIIGLSDGESLAVAFDQAYPHAFSSHDQGFVGQHGPLHNRRPYPQI